MLPDLPARLEKYNPLDEVNRHSSPIVPIPFDTSPLIMPALVRDSLPIALDAVGVEGDSITHEPEWKKLECVPLYVPVYVARYKNEERDQDFTLMLEAAGKTVSSPRTRLSAPLMSRRACPF